MIKSTPYYWVECDACGANAMEATDYGAMSDESTAVEIAVDSAEFSEVTTDDGTKLYFCLGHGGPWDICVCGNDMDSTAAIIGGEARTPECTECKSARAVKLNQKEAHRGQ